MLAFWKVVEKHVGEEGPFVPFKLFKHGSQIFYSKTKCGVDIAIEIGANFRSPLSHFQLEQKLFSQTMETFAINAFIFWRIYEKFVLLESSRIFGSPDSYRSQLNAVQRTNTFMLDLAAELLSYAASLTEFCARFRSEFDEGSPSKSHVFSSEDIKRLVFIAQNRKKQAS